MNKAAKLCMVLYGFILCSSSPGMENYQRIAPEYLKTDITSINNTIHEFQVSFQGDGIPLKGKKIDTYGYSELPTLSQLSPEKKLLPTNCRRCVWIQFDIQRFFEKLPQEIQNALEKTKKNNNGNIIGNIVIYLINQPISTEQNLNILFQPWVAGLKNLSSTTNFCETIAVTLWPEYGIRSKIAGPHEVCLEHQEFITKPQIHVGPCCTSYKAFWTIGTWQKINTVVTFHILCGNGMNTPTIEALTQSKTLKEFLISWQKNLVSFFSQDPNEPGYEQARFLEILCIIRDLIGGTYPEKPQKMLDFIRLAKLRITDKVGISQDMQVSYQANGVPIDAQVTPLYYATNVPFISPYGWSTHVETPRRRRVWATFNVRSIENILPQSVRAILQTRPRAQTIGNILIFGQPYLAIGQREYPRETNMRLHGWVAPWAKLGEIWPTDFKIPVDAGLFEPYGIKPSQDTKNALGIQKLTRQIVHYHSAFSPNNCKFIVDQERDVAYFWLVALSQDKKHALVSFCLLFNSKELKEKENNISSESITLRQALQRYETLTSLLQPQDRQPYTKALQTIYSLAKSSEQKPDMFTALLDLTEKLRRLAYQLY